MIGFVITFLRLLLDLESVGFNILTSNDKAFCYWWLDSPSNKS